MTTAPTLRWDGAPGRSDLSLLGLPALEHLRPVVELHPQIQIHRSENLFDFLERLAAEVLRLQHVLLAALNQLTYQGDVGVLQTVGGANRELQLIHRTEQVLAQRLFVL